ncbi:hypothetical protein NEUTE2DRAFT_123476 [Neurospora tetrasperma FGSC 2509]|nr:hypothetical protein NEUTE2DRAFT_123476 [Neurospora tetrasperma FGSC 2509]
MGYPARLQQQLEAREGSSCVTQKLLLHTVEADKVESCACITGYSLHQVSLAVTCQVGASDLDACLAIKQTKRDALITKDIVVSSEGSGRDIPQNRVSTRGDSAHQGAAKPGLTMQFCVFCAGSGRLPLACQMRQVLLTLHYSTACRSVAEFDDVLGESVAHPPAAHDSRHSPEDYDEICLASKDGIYKVGMLAGGVAPPVGPWPPSGVCDMRHMKIRKNRGKEERSSRMVVKLSVGASETPLARPTMSINVAVVRVGNGERRGTGLRGESVLFLLLGLGDDVIYLASGGNNKQQQQREVKNQSTTPASGTLEIEQHRFRPFYTVV